MKKIIALFLLISLVVAPLFFKDSASAATAPRLTEVRVVAITSDGNDFVWENIPSNSLKASKPLKGDTLYLKVLFMGYPKGYLINSGGVNIYPSTTRYDTDYIVGRDRIVKGYYYYLKIPMDKLPTNTVNITGLDHLLGTPISAMPISFDREGDEQ
ncbi:DUF4879 domain-containing protein [Terribacillus sp. 7520-G]|uniref:DUF4879 domain-containing protein n=1 Tax=Terribacillus TaxID=459532 RepID=UPI000BA584FE|nr:DUF4879 domain-containing protein [Terribacillus sp. 7520-G]PAD37557.1 hypothetical protein CHH53_15705 [Terribacillus sp. 7520-G]